MAKVYRDKRSRKNGGIRPWCISYVGLDGRRHRERTNASTKEEATALLQKKQSEVTRAQIVGVQSTEALKPRTFSQFVSDEYLPHCKATKTKSTYEGYKRVFRSVMPFFGKKTLPTITMGDVRRFIDQRATRLSRYKKPIAPATTNREFMFVSGALSEAVRRGYIDRNPARGISQLHEDNDQLRWLTHEEEKRILAFSADYMIPLVRFALLTGMRQGEILRLKWSDLDMDQKLVKVARTKNHKTRYIPMNTALVELIEELDPFEGPKGVGVYVFTNPDTGTRYKEVAHRFGRICDRAGLSDVTFHTLRHTFASRLAQAGVPLNTIRELLGHGDMQVTMRYAHLAPNNLREAVEMLSGVPEKQETGVQGNTGTR